MDTLSSSVSTLKVAALHTTSRELCHFKAPTTSQQLHPHHSHLLSTTKPNKTAASFSRKSLSFPILGSSGTSTPRLASATSHQKPASGYAAALLDKALCLNSLAAVQKDVQRLSRLLKNEQIRAIFADPFVGEKEKGQIVKEVVKKGKVNRYLAGLLRMLIERNKLGMVNDVLVEFERIYDEMIGTRVVFVSSMKKMEEDELFVIAKRVQKLSGAAKVKIKNFVDDRVPLPSFAV
ncbi:ATP synthase delta chain, chloroplastic [Melia azedarach]|uniref:ATP synthase delta chain, chloroplastic n=1 Tax=Melia azedarach TaxID=155640 RepID=A0ACC1YW66_MELAZ|nr:ATP synthase delta chain, chloroplastic [Melia azedarach]